ncbi:MAG: hypothetical protein AAF490_10980 [Chloroflexota bacterium]
MAFTPEELNNAYETLASVRDEWLSFSGVTAVDLGFKWTDGAMTQQLALRVHVAKKRPLEEIPENELLPKEINGIPVDVIEAEYGLQILDRPENIQLEAAAQNRSSRFDEIPAGVSIGSPHVSAGTLGAKVFDANSETPLILSNWHILAGVPTASAGLPIWQPGALDGGRNNANTFAVLERFNLGPLDAAVARITDQRPVTTATYEGHPIEDATAPMLGMTVHKSGRTTGFTEGFIDGVQMTVSLNYGTAGTRTIQNVIHIVPLPGSGNVEISSGGDSGSVWVDKASGKAVGLHFAGESSNTAPEHALANDITAVIQILQIKFKAQLAPPAPPEDPTPPTDPPPPLPEPTPPSAPPEPELSFWQRLIKLIRSLFGLD